jgi:putative tricarboxylic transport membrane protein
MRINYGESAVAAAIILFAGTMAYIGFGYPVGTIGDMGPGYFPVMVSLAAVAIGIVIFFEVLFAPREDHQVSLRAVAFVLISLLAWALLAERFGLVPATVALVLLASFARPPVFLFQAGMTAVFLSIAAVAIFIYAFDLPLPIVNW